MGLAAAGMRHGLRQPVFQQHAVGQAGQRVVVGQEFDLLLGGLALGDIGADAAVTAELTVLEQRLAADGEPAQLAGWRFNLVVEILEGQVRIQGFPVLLPLRWRDAEQWQLPSGFAGGQAGRQIRGATRNFNEAEVGVLFPEPVGGHLQQVAQPGFAGTQVALDLLTLRHLLHKASIGLRQLLGAL